MKTNILVAAIVIGAFVSAAPPSLAQHDHGHGHAGATTQAPAADESQAPMGHLRHLAALRSVLADAKAAAEAGDSTKAAAGIAAAQDLVAKMSTVAVVNSKCPIMGAAVTAAGVDVSLTRTFQGKMVGFCCAGCPDAWDKLSDAEKAKKLQAAMDR